MSVSNLDKRRDGAETEVGAIETADFAGHLFAFLLQEKGRGAGVRTDVAVLIGGCDAVTDAGCNELAGVWVLVSGSALCSILRQDYSFSYIIRTYIFICFSSGIIQSHDKTVPSQLVLLLPSALSIWPPST